MTFQMPPQRPAPPAHGLFQAVGEAEAKDIFNAIGFIYEALPDTSCARSGFCCSLLPPLLPIEMLAWLRRQASQAAQARAAQVALLVEHFLLNAAVRRPCPWALPRACASYEHRFFACRAYGLWSAEAYVSRREAALTAQTQVAQAWSRLGVELPEEVLSPGPDYCAKVRQAIDEEKRPISDQDLTRAEEELAGLSRGLPGESELLACGGDLAYLLARQALGEGECLAAKVEVTRALLDDRIEQAAEALNQCLTKASNWSLSWPEISS